MSSGWTTGSRCTTTACTATRTCGARLEAERRGGEVVDAALDWLRTLPAGPFFLWVHLYDPHAPYDPPAEFLARAGGNAYDGEVAYADAQVGRLLAALRDRGAFDDAVIAVAGDHGEGLGEHGEQAHGILAYDSTLRVPLILHGPGVVAGTFDENVSLAALAGALVALNGWRARRHERRPAPARRTSRRRCTRRRNTLALPGWHALTVLAADRWKLILSSESELYDVAADPGEQHNLAGRAPRDRRGDDGEGRASCPRREGRARIRRCPRRPPSVCGRSATLEEALTTSDDRGAAPNPARHIAAWTIVRDSAGRRQRRAGRGRAAATEGRSPRNIPARASSSRRTRGP